MEYYYNICIEKCKLTQLGSETYNDETLMVKTILQIDGSRLKLEIVKQEEYKDPKTEINIGTKILRKITERKYKII